MIDVNGLNSIIKETYGLHFKASSKRTEEGYLITLMPEGIAYTITFSITILIGWRSMEISFVAAKFAAELVKKMGRARNDQKKIFSLFVKAIVEDGASFSLKINGDEHDPDDHSNWPETWQHIHLKMRKDAIVFKDSDVGNDEMVIPWCIKFAGAVFALLPIESNGDSIQHDEEGSYKESTSKKYERSLLNRALCIEIHGSRCRVCGFSFEKYYGTIGKGFIHVHHILPLSLMSAPEVLDPLIDLIPVCANCHGMLHRKSPPYSVEELQVIIESKK